jgi:D-alanyl-D-alanine carboxypeptidase (penicillin-binding protein 5/6)
MPTLEGKQALRAFLLGLLLILAPFLVGFGPPAIIESDEAHVPLYESTVKTLKATTVPVIDASAAVAVDGETGTVLFDKNARVRRPPASMTKVVTAIVALEKGNLQDKVKTKVGAADMPGSSVMGLVVGDELTLKELLEGLLLPSGNDAAMAIAQHVGGSEKQFVQMMNDKVAALGLKDTHFTNPHGLQDEQHYSSAYDMAMLALYAMKNPTFAEIVKTADISVATPNRTFKLANTNPLLGVYPGVDGVKTGSTDEAGLCVVASAIQNGRRVFVTLMDSDNRVNDGTAVFDYAFKQFGLVSFSLPQSPLYMAYDANGVSYPLVASTEQKICVPLWQTGAVWSELRITGDPEKLVEKNGPIGELMYHTPDASVIRIPIYAKQ